MLAFASYIYVFPYNDLRIIDGQITRNVDKKVYAIFARYGVLIEWGGIEFVRILTGHWANSARCPQ